MNKITETFNRLKQENRTALVPYITGGDPSLNVTLQMMQELVNNGADMLEIGMPFSDPVADGAVIQAAHVRALNAGTHLSDLFDTLEEFRKTDSQTPIILMGYLNPIETMGYDNFVKRAAKAQVDAVLLVDLPPEEGEALITVMQASGIFPIFLLAPTTSSERMQAIAKRANGFLYVVSLKGVTGGQNIDFSQVHEQVDSIRSHTSLPLAVGFGIRDGKSAAAVAEFADAVVVGSAYVSLIEKHMDDSTALLNAIAALTKELRQAIEIRKQNTETEGTAQS